MRTLLVIYCGLVIALMLWPFTFGIPCTNCTNGATWVVDEGHIQFQTPGIVKSVSPPRDLIKTLNSGQGLTIETWLTPYQLKSPGLDRIISYSRDIFHTNFTFGQYQEGLVFRLRSDAYPVSQQLFVPRVFVPEKLQHIVVSYDFSHCRIYVDGQLRTDSELFKGGFSTWNPNYLFLLGNEQTGDQPWFGSIKNVVLYDRPVTSVEVLKYYQQDGIALDPTGVVALFDFSHGIGTVFDDKSGVEPMIQLELPPSFINQRNVFLTLKRRHRRDFVDNFLLFFPFGFLLIVPLFKRFGSTAQTLLAAVCIAVVFALILESLQFFLKDRTSSFFDLVSCIAGSLTGSFVGRCSRLFSRLGRIEKQK